MIKSLKGLLGRSPPLETAKKPLPAARPKPRPTPTATDYRAVSLAPAGGCCGAAKQIAGKRFLLRDAPRLPLSGCTLPAKCSCKFRKNADRRDGDRRMFGVMENMRWFAGPESRKRGSRRSTEN